MNDLLPSPQANEVPRHEEGIAVNAGLCGALGLLPGLGLILAPLALRQGVRELRTAKLRPHHVSRGGAIAGIILGVAGVLVQAAVLLTLLWLGQDRILSAAGLTEGDEKDAPRKETSQPAKPNDAKKVKMGDNVFLEIQGDKRRVVVEAYVCMREGQLEQFLTRKQTKEHEAVLAADMDARSIHAALLLAGAKEGTPVKYAPKYEPASGNPIKITLQYEEKGKQVTVPAQQWVRNIRTRKNLDTDWVFAGSRLVDVPLEQNKKYYLANDGDVICLSNFETAMLDLPVKSPKENADLAFEAHTDRIPPLNTKVTVILEVMPEKK